MNYLRRLQKFQTPIPTDYLTDSRLTWEQLGLLVYIYLLNHTEMNSKVIANYRKTSREEVERLLYELQELDYIEITSDTLTAINHSLDLE